MSALTYRERPAAGDPAGLLVLHHGRGADENDLLGLGDVLDPQRRLHVVTPRAPLTIPGWPGHHWYVVPRVGYPDPDTFGSAYAKLAAFHDELWERTGVEPGRTIFGGFSMGSVMSYSLGLAGERPAPAGILAFSGFIPTVEGWQPDLGSRPDLPVFIAHGRNDPIMEVGFARRAKELLEAGGLPVTYHESDAAHHIDPAHVPAAVDWVSSVMARRPGADAMTDATAVRSALLELHRHLLAAQRLEAERLGGRMSASEVLQAAADDLRFSWLKELSELISGLDQARADEDAEASAALVARARSLLAPPDEQTAFGARYLRALQDHPDVVLAHRDVTAALSA